MSKFINLTGLRFGRLTILKRENNSPSGQPMWLCLCECGKKKIIQGYHIRSGNTRSCGCLQKEIASMIKTQHGYGKTKIYKVWTIMIQRCVNTNNKEYHNYGKRNIRVCARWRKFKNFLEDMGEAPVGYQIDRIDNNGNYCLENCHWVTPKQNSQNKRNNHLATFNGKTQCLHKWAEDAEINYRTFHNRIVKLRWSIEKALTIPVRKKRRK